MAQNGNKQDDGVPVGAIAAGVLAAGAAAAGYYFYGSKNAEQHRKEAAKWAKDMKRDVVKEAKKFQGLGEEAMHFAVDKVAQRFEAQGIDRADIDALVKELKGNWKKVRAEVSGKAAGASASKKAPKKAAKKSPKKIAKKKA